MTKVISLSNEAYTQMKAAKQGNESFSDVVLRLIHTTRQRSLADFFGKWPGTLREIEDIKKTLETERKRFKTREAKF